MNFSELIGTLAYIQLYTLIESILFFFLIFILGIILPAKFFRAKYLTLGSLYIILASISVLILHFIPGLITFIAYKTGFTGYLLILGLFLWILISGFVIVVRVAYRFIHHADIADKIKDILDRVVVLTSFYLVVDLISVFIVVIRNVI
jgi:hypothetical protein